MTTSDQIRLSKIEQYFSTRNVTLDNEAKARELMRDQRSYWTFVADVLGNQHRYVEHQEATGKLRAAIIKTSEDSKLNVFEIDGKFTITSNLPLIDENNGFLIDIVENNYFGAVAATLDAIAPQLWGNGQIRPLLTDNSVLNLFNDPRYLNARSDANNGSQLLSALDNAFVVFRTGTDQELQRINEELIRLRSDTDTAQRLVESRMIDLKEAQASDAEQLASDFTAFKVDKTEEINAAREAFEEGLRLRAAFDLWRSKAMWHGVRFWIGLTLFVGGVIAAISSIVRYGKEFLAILPMKNEEPTYLAILIVVICAGGYGWVLRFFARYASDNLALGADAAQRRTMVHTYLALAADKDIKVEPSDRSMMLAAAFRPLPGQSTDDINVPTIVEVVQKAVGGGKAG